MIELSMASRPVLATALIEQHGADPQGTVYVGICLPGLELIEARIVGFREQMASMVPNVEIPPNFDVAFDQTENFARWNDVIDQNPGGLAYVGYCENDLPSLVRIKEADAEADYLIGSIGLNPDGLQGIADGQATKLFLPLETSGILGSLGAIGEIFGSTDDPMAQ